MAVCKECGDEVASVKSIKVAGRTRKVCEDCADRIQQEADIARESESVVQSMMGFTGRR